MKSPVRSWFDRGSTTSPTNKLWASNLFGSMSDLIMKALNLTSQVILHICIIQWWISTSSTIVFSKRTFFSCKGMCKNALWLSRMIHTFHGLHRLIFLHQNLCSTYLEFTNQFTKKIKKNKKTMNKKTYTPYGVYNLSKDQ